MPPCPWCKLYCRSSVVDPEESRHAREARIKIDRELALSNGGWAGQLNERLPLRVARKVQEFVQLRPAVLHSDELIDKKDAKQVKLLLEELLAHELPVQVVFLQGAVPLQTMPLFKLLCQMLRQLPIWSINLGELRFSAEQSRELEKVLRESIVTHMFYE